MSGKLIDAALLRENVESTTERLRQAPADGRVRPWVSTRLDRDVRAVARFTQYDQPHELRSDESVGRAGLGSAPSPIRYLLSAIGFCLQVWCAKVASLRDLVLEDLRIDVRTMLDTRGEHLIGDVPSYPQWFILDVRVRSSSSTAQLVEVVEEATRRCPVSSLVAKAAPVYTVIVHNGRVAHDDRPQDLLNEHEEITTG